MKKSIIEVATFKVKEGVSDEQVLQLSKTFIHILKQDFKGFIKRTLTQQCVSNTWVELVWWQSMDAAKFAFNNATKTIEFEQYCSIMKEEGSDLYYIEEMHEC